MSLSTNPATSVTEITVERVQRGLARRMACESGPVVRQVTSLRGDFLKTAVQRPPPCLDKAVHAQGGGVYCKGQSDGQGVVQLSSGPRPLWRGHGAPEGAGAVCFSCAAGVLPCLIPKYFECTPVRTLDVLTAQGVTCWAGIPPSNPQRAPPVNKLAPTMQPKTLRGVRGGARAVRIFPLWGHNLSYRGAGLRIGVTALSTLQRKGVQ